MRLKSRLARRVKIHKPKEEKVPVAWQQGRELPRLGYQEAATCEDTELERRLRGVTRWRVSEAEEEVWWGAGEIAGIHFEHATLHNVDFEWGTFGRAVRFKPDVHKCQKKVNEPICVRKAIQCQIVLETADKFETQKVEKLKATKIKGSKCGLDSGSADTDMEIARSLAYNHCLFSPWARDPLRLGAAVFYRAPEAAEAAWELAGEVAEVRGLYEHAALELVEFEWGSWGRAVRYKADVRGKDVKLARPQLATQEDVILAPEQTRPLALPPAPPPPCHALLLPPPRVSVTVCRVVEPSKDDTRNMIYKNTKYFCKRCDIYICNACFTCDCLDHDVQWIGNATFACESIYHKPAAG